MRVARTTLVPLCLLLGSAVPALVAADAPAGALAPADEQTLKSARLSSAGPALLDFFRRRASEAADPARLDELVRQLSAAEAEARDRALGELVGLGPAAVPALRRAANSPENETAAELARQGLHLASGQGSPPLVASAARALTSARPDGAVVALLNYLPFADDDSAARAADAP